MYFSMLRTPHLDVIALRGAEAEITDAALDDPIWQLQALQDLFGVRHHRLELVVRLLRRRELYQLDLVELVLAVDALHVLAVRSRLAPIRRRECRVAKRERRFAQHFAAVHRRQRHLRGRDEVERAPLVARRRS